MSPRRGDLPYCTSAVVACFQCCLDKEIFLLGPILQLVAFHLVGVILYRLGQILGSVTYYIYNYSVDVIDAD